MKGDYENIRRVVLRLMERSIASNIDLKEFVDSDSPDLASVYARVEQMADYMCCRLVCEVFKTDSVSHVESFEIPATWFDHWKHQYMNRRWFRFVSKLLRFEPIRFIRYEVAIKGHLEFPALRVGHLRKQPYIEFQTYDVSKHNTEWKIP